MARRRHTDPRICLERLLDRHEGNSTGGTIAEFVAQNLASAVAEERFRDYVHAAERAGAVRVHMDRDDLAHLIKRVELVDPASLYIFLGRAPRTEQVGAAVDTLVHGISGFPPERQAHARAALEEMTAAWNAGERYLRLAAGDVEALDFLRAWSAVAGRPAGDMRDLRTFSRQACGDSKLIERQLRRVLAAARGAGMVAPGCTDTEAAAILGLEKFPHLVQVAGGLPALAEATARGCHLGIHPELIADLKIPRISAVLTIENYASFNRYVREAMGPDEVVVYTGGWPGRAEAALLRRLAPRSARILHWGDIDMAGAGIADAVWRVVGRDISLHQMEIGEAKRHGQPRLDRPISLDRESPAASLAAWLAGEEACVLEQEELDPRPVSADHDQAAGAPWAALTPPLESGPARR